MLASVQSEQQQARARNAGRPTGRTLFPLSLVRSSRSSSGSLCFRLSAVMLHALPPVSSASESRPRETLLHVRRPESEARAGHLTLAALAVLVSLCSFTLLLSTPCVLAAAAATRRQESPGVHLRH